MQVLVVQEQVNFNVGLMDKKKKFPASTYQSICPTRETVPLTLRVYHVLNESSQELNDACVRVLTPKYIKYVENTDTFVANVTGNITALAYLDYCVSVLDLHIFSFFRPLQVIFWLHFQVLS